MTRFHAFVFGVALLAGTADAQQFPTRPIRFVVPFSPGGPADIAARVVSVKATELLGQPMVIDNRPGGGGIAGAEIVAKAKPDGYTVLLCSTSVLVFNPILQKAPYDPMRDFTHVSLVMSAPYLLLVHPSFPAQTVSDLLAVAKTRPNGLNYGSSGAGSAAHLTGERFRAMTGIRMTHVPYKGSGPAAIDLMAGQLDLVFESLASSLAHVNAKRLRTLGVSTLKRFPLTPQIPTISESGVPGFESVTWQGFCAPAGTPKPVVATLNRAVAAAGRSTDAAERLAALGAQGVGNSPEEFVAFVKAEIPRWAKSIRDSGAKVE